MKEKFEWIRIDGIDYKISKNRMKHGRPYCAVFCCTADRRCLTKYDIDPGASDPDRELSSGFYMDRCVDFRQAVRKACHTLSRKAAPYFERCQRLTLWDLYQKYCDMFYASHNTEWNERTQKQYRSLFNLYLKDIYSRYTLPLTPSTCNEYRERIYALPVSTQQCNQICDKSTAFLSFLELRGYTIGAHYDLERRAPNRDEELASRFSAVRSINWSIRTSLLRILTETIRSNHPDAPCALVLLLMLCAGFRTAEALGLLFKNLHTKRGICCIYVCTQLKNGKIVDALKTENAYRWVPAVTLLRDALQHRQRRLQSACKLNQTKIQDVPVCAYEDTLWIPSEATVCDYFRKIANQVGLPDTLIIHYQQLLQHVPLSELRGESSIFAYIMRRDYITRLYMTSLPAEIIDYLSAHRQQGGQKYHVTIDQLISAYRALEDAYADAGLSAPVCYGCRDLAPDTTKYIPAHTHMVLNLPADSTVEIVTPEPGTQLMFRVLDAHEDAPAEICQTVSAYPVVEHPSPGVVLMHKPKSVFDEDDATPPAEPEA